MQGSVKSTATPGGRVNGGRYRLGDAATSYDGGGRYRLDAATSYDGVTEGAIALVMPRLRTSASRRARRRSPRRATAPRYRLGDAATSYVGVTTFDDVDQSASTTTSTRLVHVQRQ